MVFRRLVAFLLPATLALSCGRTPPPSPVAPPLPAAQAKAAVDKPLPPPLPDFGVAYETYVSARVLDLCAQKYGQNHQEGERLAVEFLAGRKPVWNLDLALTPEANPVNKPTKSGKGAKGTPVIKGDLPAKAAAESAQVAPEPAAENEADRATRALYLHGIDLSISHTPTSEAINARVQKCLYAKEIGLIEQSLIDRYAKAFVEIACLQAQMTDDKGKLDTLAHAQAAAKIFQENEFQAADFSRIGLIFGRFPIVQTQIQEKKAGRCPDPRVAAFQARQTGQWSGSVSGERNGSVQFSGTDGALTGQVQWNGVPRKQPDGRAQTQPAIAVEGRISGTSLNAFGQVGQDWVRLTGTVQGAPGAAHPDSLTGTWQGEVDFHKLKGTFKAERVPPAAPVPAVTTPTAP